MSVEPGRAIVAAAAMTVYTVGTIKQIPGVRTYVAVDGGMSDNPRPVLYGSGLRGVPAARGRRRTPAARPGSSASTARAATCCSFDARLPADIAVGDLLATPVTGAYGHSMGSNYNKITRPPVVFVADGRRPARRPPRNLRRPPRHRRRLNRYTAIATVAWRPAPTPVDAGSPRSVICDPSPSLNTMSWAL